jgi:hypothetical protein
MKPTDTFSWNASAGRHDSHGDGGAVPHHHSPEEMHNDDVAHEHSDINIPAIVWSAVLVSVVCAVTAVLMLLFFNMLEAQAKARDPKRSPLARPATVMPPTTTASPEFGSAPEPRLLTNEPRILRQVRDGEQRQLHEYGWVDEKAGVARIPIDAAKELVIKRGLPIRPDPLTDPRLGTHVPAFGESSSGRTITRPPADPPAQPATKPPAPAPSAPTHK